MTMTKGEKAELTIEPEWGYGKKGNIDAGYPLIKAACTETLIAKCFQYYNNKSYKTEQVWYLTPLITKPIFSRGVAGGGGGPGVPVTPPWEAFFWANNQQYSGGENAMTISWP